MSNHGIPPPPPPQYSYGALSQGTFANGHPLSLPSYQGQHHLPTSTQSMVHYSNPQLLQQHQACTHPQYQYQYQYYNTSYLNHHAQYYQPTTPYNNQSPYAQYANYTAPPQPPPPPKTPRSISNPQITIDNKSTLIGNLNNDHPKKKINNKMVQKYSGRGLKTITISGPGLRPQKFKICVGNHPDDVKKWIDERKKRYPRLDGSHRSNGRGSVSNASAGCKRVRCEVDERNVLRKQTCVNEKELNGIDPCSDEEGVTSRLSSLLGGYDSSSSEDRNSEPKSRTSANHSVQTFADGSEKTAAATVQPMRICKYYQRGKCRNGASCRFLHSHDIDDHSPNQKSKQKTSSQSDRRNAQDRYDEELQVLGLVAPSHRNRHTRGEKVITNTSLLHKLLQRDKERERRLTLQLLRYIVDCDFLQRGGDAEEYCIDDVGNK